MENDNNLFANINHYKNSPDDDDAEFIKDLLSIAQQLADWENDPDHFGGDLADLVQLARAAIVKAKGEA